LKFNPWTFIDARENHHGMETGEKIFERPCFDYKKIILI
jgi:hypothetical protein